MQLLTVKMEKDTRGVARFGMPRELIAYMLLFGNFCFRQAGISKYGMRLLPQYHLQTVVCVCQCIATAFMVSQLHS